MEEWHHRELENIKKQIEVKSQRELEKAKAIEMASLRYDEEMRISAAKELAARQAASEYNAKLAVETAHREAMEKE